TASERIFIKSRSRSAKLPNRAIAACWRSSFWTCAAASVLGWLDCVVASGRKMYRATTDSYPLIYGF
ncbi:MAG: hypothetical protein WCA28_19905, partial [Bradyrhizobium sp.]